MNTRRLLCVILVVLFLWPSRVAPALHQNLSKNDQRNLWALLYSCFVDDVGRATEILHRQPNLITLRNKHHQNILGIAVQCGAWRSACVFLNYGADVNAPSILKMRKRVSTGFIETLINAFRGKEFVGYIEDTPIFYAALYSSPAMVRSLIEYGVTISPAHIHGILSVMDQQHGDKRLRMEKNKEVLARRGTIAAQTWPIIVGKNFSMGELGEVIPGSTLCDGEHHTIYQILRLFTDRVELLSAQDASCSLLEYVADARSSLVAQKKGVRVEVMAMMRMLRGDGALNYQKRLLAGVVRSFLPAEDIGSLQNALYADFPDGVHWGTLALLP